MTRWPELAGLRVLVVEDEFAVLLLLEDMLGELGCTVFGSASRVSDALEMLRARPPDAAVLDVNVAGEEIYPVARELAERNIPIVFATGYGEGGINLAWRSLPVLQKPYRIEELASALIAAKTKQQASS